MLSENPMGVDLTALSMNLNSFREINGKNYYPQVFIPFYLSHVAKGDIGKKDITFLVTCVDGVNVFTGYKLNSKGELYELKSPITKQYAQENEVWVVSINERVNDDASVPEPYIKRKLKTFGDIDIVDMKIKDHKESWVYGASEVHMKSFITYANDGIDPDTGSWAQGGTGLTTSSNSGFLVRQYSRSEVSNETNVNIAFEIMSNWDCSSFTVDMVLYGYVIFEYDPFPTGTRTEQVLMNSENFYYTFRSAHSSYSCYKMYGNLNGGAISSSLYVDGYDVNNSAIEFDVEAYNL